MPYDQPCSAPLAHPDGGHRRPDGLFIVPSPIVEANLRRGFSRLDQHASAGVQPGRADRNPQEIGVSPEVWSRYTRKLLTASARFLELHLVQACTVELLAEAGITTVGGADSPSVEALNLRARVIERCGLDPIVVFDAEWQELPRSERARLQARRQLVPLPSMPALVRHVRGIVEQCPIHELIESGEGSREATVLAERTLAAYEGLRAFLLRVDPEVRKRLQVLGRHYAAGRMTAGEVALVVDADVPDVVVALEEMAVARDPAAIHLSDPERAERLAAIRADRLRRAEARRQGDPDTFEVLARRAAVASERIEGVDARTWLRTNARVP